MATEIEIARTKDNLRKDIETEVQTRLATIDTAKFLVENIVLVVYQSIIVEYTPKFTEIEKQLKSMKSHLESLDDRILRIECCIDDIDQDSRVDLLMLNGVKQSPNLDLKTTILNILRGKMELFRITDADISKGHRFAFGICLAW